MTPEVIDEMNRNIIYYTWAICGIVVYLGVRKKGWAQLTKLFFAAAVSLGITFLAGVSFLLIFDAFPAQAMFPGVSPPLDFQPVTPTATRHFSSITPWPSRTPYTPNPRALATVTEIARRLNAAKTPRPTQPSSSACSGGCIAHKSGCDIKGDLYPGTKEKIYFLPGSQYYNDVQIDTDSGERWFCTESEAQAAGWQRSQ